MNPVMMSYEPDIVTPPKVPVSMIKKILVPTDYSESSLNALDTAIAIAGNNGASIQILHINDGQTGGAVNASRKKQISEAMAGSISKKHGINTEIVFMEGFVGPTIIKTAFEKKPHLIVMGAHGASGHRDLFVGSNSYYVIKKADCPVLIVPEGRKYAHFDKILFPVRPTPGAFKSYQFLTCLAKHSEPDPELEIFGISINKNEDDVEQLTRMTMELESRTNDSTMKCALSFGYGKDIAVQVLEKADRMNADLLVVSPGVDVANKKSFIGPFSQRIINHSKAPVLSMPRI